MKSIMDVISRVILRRSTMDLWFNEWNTDTCKFSIKIKDPIYSEKTPFQKIDFFESYDFGIFLH